MTRSAAEKWLEGITALYGLFGLAGVALGKDAVKDLSTISKAAVAAAVVIGLAATLRAVVLGYKAAFGWPVPVDVSDDAKLRAWFESHRDNAKDSAENLRRAVRAAVTAVGALFLAVGVIWFGPSARPVPSLVKVDYADPGNLATAGTLCGELADTAAESTVAVRVRRPSEESTEVVSGAWVKSITPVASCT